MKELVEVITKALVDDPESVVVTEREEKKATVLEVRVADSDMGKVIFIVTHDFEFVCRTCSRVLQLKVAPSDMGKVIGKQGRIAKAIRSVVKAAASKEDKKVIVDILD